MKINLWQKQRADTLWCFVTFAFGVAFYFGLPIEPLFFVLLFLNIFLLASIIWKNSFVGRLAFFFCLGLTIASGRTYFTNTKFLPFPLWKQTISGEIAEAYSTHTGQKIILKNVNIKNASITPKVIRLSFKEHSPKLNPGDDLTFLGQLSPPSAHQALRFFYQGIEAQGGIQKILTHHTGAAGFFENTRDKIMTRLWQHLSPTQAEIAIPLITGEQQVVSSDLYATYRKAGIAHVLSVSGFHMALLAGFVFFLIRGLLALMPKICSLVSAKKLAAVVAFFVTGFYLFISGHQVPAIRSFMMISLVFLGILIDRKTVSLYSLLLVGFCLLIFHPEWITSVSFQLSFMAVMILVGIFEDLTHLFPRLKFVHIFLAAIVANILVTLALAPFVAYHFNQFNPYGVMGNLLTSLLFSFFVMPMLFMGIIFMPLHWETPFIKGAGFFLDIITQMAEKIASLPFSEILIPSFSAWGLSLVAFGLCFLCLIKTKRRVLGLLFISVGLCVGFILQPKPDIIVGDFGRTILIRNNQDRFDIKGDSASWTAQRWLQKNGQSTAENIHQNSLSVKGYSIALAPDGCEGADLAILAKKEKNCHAKDIFKPTRKSTYFLFLKDKIIFQSEDALNRYRPWKLTFKSKKFNKNNKKRKERK